MAEIKCPHCGKNITLDKSSYDALLSEVEKEEIEKRLAVQTRQIEEKYKAQFELAANKEKNKQDEIINNLKAQLALLEEKNRNSDKDIALAVSKAVEEEKRKASSLNEEIIKLKGEIENEKTNGKLNAAKAIEEERLKLAQKEKEIMQLQSELEVNKTNNALATKQLKEQYDFALKAKDEEIERYKQFRLGDSTKDLGESLEQYCHDAFDEIRAVAYPRAYFDKDNIVDEEGKGDFIFRDFDENDIEIVSIMFEMKNQKEDTEHKHKNEEFFKKLDKNRTSKGCEYAVLVTTLEEDSKLYNSGIVDVSHKYKKMFVVRPQFFLTIIGLIRNMAIEAHKYKKELVSYKQENIDITNFENAVNEITQKIADDYEKASKYYENVDKICDDIIKKVNDFREAFRMGQKWIGAAQNQLPNLEVRKLTKKNPTMAARFAELNEDKGEE